MPSGRQGALPTLARARGFPRITMRTPIILAAGLALLLPPLAARAQSAPAVPPAQSRAFALGYTMRACDLRAIAFTRAVKGLKDVDDAQEGAEVARLGREATALRHTQSVSYGQISGLLAKMGAPAPLRAWASKAAAGLAGPPPYGEEARALTRSAPDSAAVMATLDEISGLKTNADAHLPLLAAWLTTTDGPLSVWTAEVGTYAADLRAAASAPGSGTPPVPTARRLLRTAPPGAPAATRADLAAMVPRGGNLSDLATVSPLAVSPQTLSGLFESLLAVYVPRAK